MPLKVDRLTDLNFRIFFHGRHPACVSSLKACSYIYLGNRYDIGVVSILMHLITLGRSTQVILMTVCGIINSTH